MTITKNLDKSCQIQNLITQIKSTGFYKFIHLKTQEQNEESEGYEGSCPCFSVVVLDGVEIDCSCWRSGGAAEFEYSGLRIIDKNKKYSQADLEDLARYFLSEITIVWSNTDWQYKVNDGDVVDYVIKDS